MSLSPLASWRNGGTTIELVVGDRTLEGTDLGPLISAEQRVQVHGFVKRAVADGARVLTGGTVPEGAPFAGWKASGIGRELGRRGLEEFCETTAIQL